MAKQKKQDRNPSQKAHAAERAPQEAQQAPAESPAQPSPAHVARKQKKHSFGHN